MSNQRAGKTYKASGAETGSEMKLYQFFKQARKDLEDYGHEDAAFYFEQIETWLTDGHSLPQGREVAKVLGL